MLICKLEIPPKCVSKSEMPPENVMTWNASFRMFQNLKCPTQMCYSNVFQNLNVPLKYEMKYISVPLQLRFYFPIAELCHELR